MSGKLTVRGWDKNELRARSTDADQLELRRIDKVKDEGQRLRHDRRREST
jgi:hypothetical protein